MEYILGKLKEKGMRLTEQRKSVLSSLEGLENSISIKELYQHLQDKKVKIDEASVYRFVETLKDFGFVHAQTDGRLNLCKHQKCNHSFHYSLECIKCHKVSEPSLDKAKEKDLATIFGVDLNNIEHIRVSSVCEGCS